MIKKPTNELMDALTRNSSIDGYLNKEKEFLIDMSVSEMLGFLLQEKNLQKSPVIKKAQLNEIYGYQILAGKRMPSRDKLIALAFGMELSLEETQQLLKYAGFSPLYPKSDRDSIIIWSLLHHLDVIRTNECLFDHSVATL